MKTYFFLANITQWQNPSIIFTFLHFCEILLNLSRTLTHIVILQSTDLFSLSSCLPYLPCSQWYLYYYWPVLGCLLSLYLELQCHEHMHLIQLDLPFSWQQNGTLSETIAVSLKLLQKIPPHPRLFAVWKEGEKRE